MGEINKTDMIETKKEKERQR